MLDEPEWMPLVFGGSSTELSQYAGELCEMHQQAGRLVVERKAFFANELSRDGFESIQFKLDQIRSDQ